MIFNSFLYVYQREWDKASHRDSYPDHPIKRFQQLQDAMGLDVVTHKTSPITPETGGN